MGCGLWIMDEHPMFPMTMLPALASNKVNAKPDYTASLDLSVNCQSRRRWYSLYIISFSIAWSDTLASNTSLNRERTWLIANRFPSISKTPYSINTLP
jgi:hypothetical protein